MALFARAPLLCTAFFAIVPLLCALVENEIQMTIYIHRVYSGPTANQVTVINGNSSSAFGRTAVHDWAIREGPDASAKVIGRAQGFHMKSTQTEERWYTSTTLVFSDESRYGGSTLQIIGFIRFDGKENLESSIVGGTGKFTMARGVAKYTYLKTNEPNSTLYKVNVRAYYSSMDSTALSGKTGRSSEPIVDN